MYWRLGSESNRRRRICNPLHNHSATEPGGNVFRRVLAKVPAEAADYTHPPLKSGNCRRFFRDDFVSAAAIVGAPNI